MKLTDMQDTVLMAALVTNPSAAYFPWNCSDYPYASYPNGIPRANVLAAFQSKCDLRIGKGGSFPVIYAPGIINISGGDTPSNPFGGLPPNFSAGLAQTQTAFPASSANPALKAPAPGTGGQLLQAAPVMAPAGGGISEGDSQIITIQAQVV